MKKATEYNLRIKVMFIDFNKPFDFVKHRYSWRAEKNQEVEAWAIRTVKNLYKNSKAL